MRPEWIFGVRTTDYGAKLTVYAEGRVRENGLLVRNWTFSVSYRADKYTPNEAREKAMPILQAKIKQVTA